jgi:hypothetical protein
MYKLNVKFKNLIVRVVWSLSAIFVTFVAMFLISFCVVILTGVFAKNIHYVPDLKSKSTDQKFIVLTPTKHMEDVIRKSNLETVQLPPKISVQ